MMDHSPVGAARTHISFLAGGLAGGVAAVALILLPVAAASRALLPGDARPVAALLVLAVVAVAEAGRLALPRVRRQARQSLGNLSPTLGSFMFGVDLGSGVRTHTSSVTLYTALSPAVLGAPAVALIGLGAAFGLVRGLVPLDRAWAGDPHGWDGRLRNRPVIPRVARAAALACALALVFV